MPRNTAMSTYDMIIDMYDMQEVGNDAGFLNYGDPIAMECRVMLSKSSVWSGTMWYYSDADTLIIEFKPQDALTIKGTNKFGNLRSKQGLTEGKIDEFLPWDENTSITQHKVYVVQKVMPIINGRGLVESVEYTMVSTKVSDEEFNRGLNNYQPGMN